VEVFAHTIVHPAARVTLYSSCLDYAGNLTRNWKVKWKLIVVKNP